MINLKRNNKGELAKATGLRSRKNTIYTPGQNEDFTLSRSKFDDFMTCPRCFYINIVKAVISPGNPPYKLNTLTDTLLKKEFDECRDQKKPHRLFEKYNLSHVIPFDPGTQKVFKKSENKNVIKRKIDIWRDSLHGGLEARFKDTNIILKGGVDDVWYNTKTEEVIVADYKSQEDQKGVNQDTYFDSPYKEGYMRQLDFYAYLLKSMGYKVSKDAYLYICNAKELDEGFHGKMHFDETIIHYQIKTEYLEDEIQKMIDTMNSKDLPNPHESCENCAQARKRSNFDIELSESNISEIVLKFAKNKLFLESFSKILDEIKNKNNDKKIKD